MQDLIVQSITLPDRFSVTGKSEEDRNSLLKTALEIGAVSNGEQNSTARDVCVELRRLAKDAEAIRVQLTQPLLQSQRLLKSIVDDFLEPVKSEIDRIERLATQFALAERKREAAEAQAKMDLAKEAQTEEDFAMVVNEPVVAAQKAQGQQLRQELMWEVTDINMLYKARPDLCRIEPRASAIRACCVPELQVPGLKTWWDTKAVFTTR